MKRKTMLGLAATAPFIAAGLMFAFSQTGMAEDFFEIVPCPEVEEAAIPEGMARIVQSDGFFYEDFEGMTDGVLTDGWITVATPGLPDGKWGVGSLGTDGQAMAGTSGYTYAYILGNRDKESDLSHGAWLFSPGVKLEGDREYTIEFCTYMGGSPTTGEVLEVYLMDDQRKDAGKQQLVSLQDSSGAWKLNTCKYTPAEAGTYYLGFRCMSPPLANATLIDDVKISEGPTSGFFGYAGIDLGVTDVLRGTISGDYEVINRGMSPLELNVKSASPEISVSGLPMTVKSGHRSLF